MTGLAFIYLRQSISLSVVNQMHSNPGTAELGRGGRGGGGGGEHRYPKLNVSVWLLSSRAAANMRLYMGNYSSRDMGHKLH